MEQVGGRTLRQILDERGVLAPTEALHVVEQILQAMAIGGHETSVQCDIQPSNIVIGDAGRVKVRDTGVAGPPPTSSDAPDAAWGASACMSPERAAGRSVDIRSDLYAVGVVLYEVLTGEQPFTAESTPALVRKIIEVEPIPPRVLNINVPDLLDKVVRKALAKHPDDRFQSAAEMLTALRAVSLALGGTEGGGNSSRNRGETPVSEGMPSVGPEAQVPIRAGVPPPPPGRAAPSPRAPRRDVPPRRVETDMVVMQGKQASWSDPNEDLRKNHNAGPPSPCETVSSKAGRSGRPWSAARVPGSLAMVLLVLVAGGMVLWLVFSTPVEQASSPLGVSPGTSVGSGQNSTVEADLSNSVDSLVSQAKLLWESNPDTAQKLLEQAVALDPHHFEATFQLARFLTFKKEFPAAIQQYQNALRINNQVPEVFFNLGYIYVQQGALDQAIVNYEASQALSPPYLDEVLTNLAVCHWKKNNAAQARVLLKQALDFNPNNEPARDYLNTLEKSVGPQK